ncbi:MAG: PilN domain-containing protein [Sphingomonadaceae bacterium]|nr:PilN domain-containing protein [Sphingomonadaceae bacterium]
MPWTDLLNQDVSVTGASIARGFEWWRAELAGMVPRRLRAHAGSGAAVRADLALRCIEPIGTARPARGGSAAIGLDAGQLLVRPVELPRLSPRDSRAFVSLDLDRLQPLPADEVWFDLALLPDDGVGRLRPAHLAIVRRATAAQALDLAVANGLRPSRLGLVRGGGVVFDFLPAIRAALRPAPWWSRRSNWWALAGAAAAANIGLAIERDRADVERLQTVVAAQGDAVALAARQRARVTRENARREALAATRAEREPLAMIAAVNRALPPPIWVERLQWDGQHLRLSGQAPGGADPVAALRRDPRFTSVRATSAALAPAGLAASPFELSADWRGRP